MTSLLDLPSEIRLIIYSHLLNPNEYVKCYRKLRDQWSSVAGGPLCTIPRPYVKRYTPCILLLNKKISTEALHYLYRIPLNLYGTPSTYFVMRQMDITENPCWYSATKSCQQAFCPFALRYMGCREPARTT